MKYIENELLCCKSGLQKASGERYCFLYAIQQALEWALDPMSYATPVDIVLNDKVVTKDIQASSEDCLAVPHPLPSSNICSHNGLPQQ